MTGKRKVRRLTGLEGREGMKLKKKKDIYSIKNANPCKSLLVSSCVTCV